MELSLWAYYYPIANRLVVSLCSTTSFLVLHPLLFLCFLAPSPPGSCRVHTVDHQPPSGETPKIQNHCSPPLICSFLFLPVESTSTSTSILFIDADIMSIIFEKQLKWIFSLCLYSFLQCFSARASFLPSYCSEECRLLAWQQYHAAECHIPLADLQNLGLYARLALRTVLTAGPCGIQGAFSTALDSSRIYLRSEEQSNSRKLAGVREVIIKLDHKDGEKKNEDKLKEKLNSVPESRENRTSFLSASGHKGRGYKGVNVSEIACLWSFCQTGSHLSVAYCYPFLLVFCPPYSSLLNCKASNVQTDQHIVEDEAKLGANMTESNMVLYSEHRIALAIFPTLSLLNHACRPNVVLHFCGRTAYLRALHPIAAGQELLLCYGPQEGRMPRAKRIRKLRAQYYFHCSCQACQEKPKDPSKDRLLRCEHCGHDLPVSHPFRKGYKRNLDKGWLPFCLSNLQEHEKLGELYDLLARGHAMQGQWKEAAKWVQKSLVGVKKRFGEKSPEAAQEMFKLAQLLFNGRCVVESVPVVDEALVLLNNSFGCDHFLVAELQQMRACLQQVQDSVRLLSIESAPC
uniref:SET domain-containing protein n=1 Tax=Eptatretus burgeri TaxID=7764 RepID=A0A8C4QFI7_EPTBU